MYKGKEFKRTLYAYTNFLPDANDGSAKHGCLTLDKPTHFNNGRYTLIAENKLGRDNATATGSFMENPFTGDPEGVFPGEILTAVSIFVVCRVQQTEKKIQKILMHKGFIF